jgi:hypothetical protein
LAVRGVSRPARSRRRSDVHRRRCRGSCGATPTGWATTGLPQRTLWLMPGRRGLKPAKLVTNLLLRGKVEADLAKFQVSSRAAG